MEQEGVVQETWTIPNFLVYISQSRRRVPYLFYIGEPKVNQNAKISLEAQMNMSVNINSQLVLTVSLTKREQNPSWTSVMAKITSIQLIGAQGSINWVYEKLDRMYASTYVVSTSGEVDLRTSNCTTTMSITTNSVQPFLNLIDQSLTIKFSLAFKLKKSAAANMETRPMNNLDLEIFGFQALDDFEALLHDTTTTDIEIKVAMREEKSFHCHKLILAARSPILRAMFDGPMKEANEKVLVVEDISDISEETMAHFLSFLYCGRFQDESWIKSLPQLTYAADKYCVGSLKELCDCNLIRSVTCQNVLAIANLAQRHQLTKAIGDIRDFINKNPKRSDYKF